MNNKFNVIQVGLGPMGQRITSLLLRRKNLNLKGVVDINPNFIGKTLGEIINFDSKLAISSDLDLILSREKPDVTIIATSSSLEEVSPLIKQSVIYGSNVISICEELSYPYDKNLAISKELDSLARSSDVSIVGTGINPGYLMDVLPIVLSAPCEKVNSIKVTRMMNSGKRREPFQKKIGTGLNVKEFNEKITNKEITGHVGLQESIQMICSALGFTYDDFVEDPPVPILAEQDFMTSYGQKVTKGNVCGLKSKATAKRNGNLIVLLDFIAYSGDHEEYDSIEIDGIPNIHQKVIGGVHGDIGTAAMVANLVPKVIEARSGLLTMKDLPIPCYTANIYKR